MEFNLAQVHEAVEAAVPDRECIVWRDRRLTYAAGRRPHPPPGQPPASAAGLGAHTERGRAGRPRVGPGPPRLYLHNGNEYLEAMLGAYKARVAPFNVNYRYVAEELRYLLDDAGAAADRLPLGLRRPVAEVLPDLPGLEVLLQVDDGSGAPLLPGAAWYEDALAAASPERPDVDAEPRRPLHPLHRRHHRHAQGRAVAPGRHLRRRHGRAQPGHRRASGRRSTSRRGRPQRRHPPAARPAVHARRRPLAGLQRVHRRQHRRHPGRHGGLRPRRRVAHHRARARGDPPHRRRRLRPARSSTSSRRSPPSGRLRPVVAAHRDLRRRAAELHR